MSKVNLLQPYQGISYLNFWCPGCNDAHTISYSAGGWVWNGDTEKPTFTPSVLVTGIKRMTDEQLAAWRAHRVLPEKVPTSCHSFVTDGHIQFLRDCTHSLAGQTVDLPQWK